MTYPGTVADHANPPVGKHLGRLPSKSDPRALMFARFVSAPPTLPKRTNFWPHRGAFPLRTFGNNQMGDCTRAKQAIAAMRMERLETRSAAQIADEEVVRVYLAMTDRLYGGGDTGAFETDALSDWRKPEYTFKDTKGRPLTIDAFLRLNPANHEELKSALFTAGAHGIPLCLNLPSAFQSISPPADWDIPAGQALIGDWLPGSWGGHSMWCRDYDEVGLWLVHTWGIPDQRVTWRAAAAYVDESHMVIDSIDFWRAQKPRAKRLVDFTAIKRAINKVSSQKVA